MRARVRRWTTGSTVADAVVVGALVLGVVGGVAGLVIGLLAYPPTAWFAVIELGVPAAVAGALGGLLAGLFVVAVRR